MPDGSDIVYSYDGSFEGLLCCVFESLEKREVPAEILLKMLLRGCSFRKNIITDLHKSNRFFLL